MGLLHLCQTLAVLLAIIVAMASGCLELHPFLFGIGGTVILLSFFGILWFWAKKRKDKEGRAAKAANLSLMAKAFEGFNNSPPLHIMIFFVLGWVFLKSIISMILEHFP